MNYFDGSIVLITLSAEAYYSGATVTHDAFVTQAFIDENEEIIEGYHFSVHELDGKHSETEGEVSFDTLDKDNAESLLAELHGESEQVFEDMLDDCIGLEEMIDLDRDIRSKIGVKTVVTFEGVEL